MRVKDRIYIKLIRMLLLGVFLAVLTVARPVAAASPDEAAEGATEQASELSLAQVLPDAARTGSATILFRDPQTGEPAQYGNKVGLYKVANIAAEDGFKLVYDELFESVGPAPTRDAQLDAALAQKLEETAEIKGISLDAPSQEISSEGSVTFDGLDMGLYLVVQTYQISASERFVIEPLLVMLPSRQGDGSLSYDVKVTAYDNTNRKKGSADQLALLSDSSAMQKLPSVGRPVWPPYVMFAVGGMLVAGGILTKREERRKNERI